MQLTHNFINIQVENYTIGWSGRLQCAPNVSTKTEEIV